MSLFTITARSFSLISSSKPSEQTIKQTNKEMNKQEWKRYSFGTALEFGCSFYSEMMSQAVAAYCFCFCFLDCLLLLFVCLIKKSSEAEHPVTATKEPMAFCCDIDFESCSNNLMHNPEKLMIHDQGELCWFFGGRGGESPEFVCGVVSLWSSMYFCRFNSFLENFGTRYTLFPGNVVEKI